MIIWIYHFNYIPFLHIIFKFLFWSEVFFFTLQILFLWSILPIGRVANCVYTSIRASGTRFLINSLRVQPQDWSIPGQTRQGNCSSLHRCDRASAVAITPAGVSDKKSLTHTPPLFVPSTQSINVWEVRRRCPPEKLFRGERREYDR